MVIGIFVDARRVGIGTSTTYGSLIIAFDFSMSAESTGCYGSFAWIYMLGAVALAARSLPTSIALPVGGLRLHVGNQELRGCYIVVWIDERLSMLLMRNLEVSCGDSGIQTPRYRRVMGEELGSV